MWIKVIELMDDDSEYPNLLNLDKVKSISFSPVKPIAWVYFHGETKVTSKGVLVESYITIVVKEKKEIVNLLEKANLLIK